MKNYEATGKTYEEALENGLQALGATISDVDITVLEEGSKGLFGLFGSRPYKVRLTLKDAEEDPLADLLEEIADVWTCVSAVAYSLPLDIDAAFEIADLKRIRWANRLEALKDG